MQFGKTLVGAIIGAALGIGLLIAVYLLFGIDKMWMAIPVAIVDGLGRSNGGGDERTCKLSARRNHCRARDGRLPRRLSDHESRGKSPGDETVSKASSSRRQTPDEAGRTGRREG